MIVYKATNKVNGKVYIGITIRTLKERMDQHLYQSKHGVKYKFQNALNKYGIDCFEWDVVDSANSIDELKNLEMKYIRQYDSFNNGYNSTRGGDGVCILQETIDFNNKINELHNFMEVHQNMFIRCFEYSFYKFTHKGTNNIRQKYKDVILFLEENNKIFQDAHDFISNNK